jgi:hypothetical protein
MNNSPKEIAMNTNGPSSSKIAKTAALAAILMSVFSGSALANRPAMEENRPMKSESVAPVQIEAEVEVIQARPQAEAPSAVESMMQRQNQQTGDVLQLPAKEIQPGETIKIKLLDLPRRGTSMEKVQQEFGQPIATSDSVGKPPITSWTYSDRVVYFEYSTVLHVVAR